MFRCSCIWTVIIRTWMHQPLNAQVGFGDRCFGFWEGTMYIYGNGQLRDSVPMQLSVQTTAIPGTWTWKTTYLSKPMPAVKDYKLVLKDASTQSYYTDEGDGLELMDSNFNNKLYSVFETQGFLST